MKELKKRYFFVLVLLLIPINFVLAYICISSDGQFCGAGNWPEPLSWTDKAVGFIKTVLPQIAALCVLLFGYGIYRHRKKISGFEKNSS